MASKVKKSFSRIFENIRIIYSIVCKINDIKFWSFTLRLPETDLWDILSVPLRFAIACIRKVCRTWVQLCPSDDRSQRPRTPFHELPRAERHLCRSRRPLYNWSKLNWSLLNLEFQWTAACAFEVDPLLLDHTYSIKQRWLIIIIKVSVI